MTKTKTTKPAKATKATKANAPEYGVARKSDVAWNETKVKVLKALAQAKAPVTAAEAAKASGLTAKIIRHYSYHAAAAGLVKVDQAKANEYRFSITAKGRKALAENTK